jgi:hypothetical protein
MRRSRLVLLGATLAAGLLTAAGVALPAPAHAFPNPVVKTAVSANNTTAVKEIPVNCDQGSFAYGGGGSISGGGAGNVAAGGRSGG